MDSFILIIEWDVPNMPPRVGPFESRAEAEDFAEVNIPNGSWLVCPLKYPYR